MQSGTATGSIASDFNLIKLDDLTEAQGVSLVERHLVSPEFISETEGRALLLSKDESMSIMINEEDHIRLQVITDGLSLEQAYDTADKLDTLLDENLEFAFDDKARLSYTMPYKPRHRHESLCYAPSAGT